MPSKRSTPPQVVGERLAAQLLAGAPAADAAGVCERLLAVQAQELRGARLAVRARTRGPTAADVDRALDERGLVVDWLNRGTLHLVRAEDHAWLHALTTPPLATGNARRLEQEGVAPEQAERGVATIERALADEGPLTRRELRARLDAAGVPTKGQAFVHVAMLASLRGVCVRGPTAGSEQAFALARDWLGERPAVDRDAALAELARRYLAGHGPASERDLARWAGLPLRDARAGLAAIASELAERDDGLLALARGPAPAGVGHTERASDPPRLPGPRLLGAFEPLLLGWADRTPLLGEHERRVVAGGVFRPFALAGGRAVATWRLRGRAVELDPFAELDPATAAALDGDADDVVRFLGLA